jgi:predicted Zn-dependent protease
MATSGCDPAEYREMRPHGEKLSRADFGGLILSADGSLVNARAQPRAQVLRAKRLVRRGVHLCIETCEIGGNIHGSRFAHDGGMIRHLHRNWTSIVITMVILLAGAMLSAQTQIELRKNSFSPAQDVRLGREAAGEVRQQLPMLRDRQTDALVDDIGARLVAAVPARFRQPAFRYSFDVVNLREINAFALPGGPMFLNRGMLQAAETDDEVAGVMAHELSHVVLRHGTLQAAKAQKFQFGALAGQILGSIVGGTKGAIIAQGSQIGLGTYFLKYGREYEREADLLGAQIMARAGYSPRQMANMFRTIQQQGGGGGPEWLSDHPDPGNRYAAINREAATLKISGAAQTGPAFDSVHARLVRMPPAPTAAQIARR